MAMGDFSAAIGAYFFGRNQPKVEDGLSINPLAERVIIEEKKKENKENKVEAHVPRFAVELDGLHCFEFLVSH